MALIDELRSIAKTVEFHLGTGTSAEGRAADEIERLQRRIVALETVIRENLDLSKCGDDPGRKLVEEIGHREGVPPELSKASPGPPAPQPQLRSADPPARLAAGLSRSPHSWRNPIRVDRDGEGACVPALGEPVRQQREAVHGGEEAPQVARAHEHRFERPPESIREREHGRMRDPQRPYSVTDPQFNPTADLHLVEVEQQLRAALRRSVRLDGVPPSEGAEPAEAGVRQVEPSRPNSIYDEIERTMASLMGRRK
jgi:hypothetical protein